MSHTHLLYHIVFATKDHMPLIRPQWAPELFAYLSGIVKNLGGRSIAINGVADHVHLLIRLMADKALSDCLREIKAGSSRWVRTRHDPKFSWQRRYGAFTVSESAARTVAKYIADQQVHHGRISFVDEYKTLLDRHGIDYDERYLWT